MDQRIQRLQGNTLLESLVNVENEHRKQDFETLSVINQAGEIVLIKDGKVNSVTIKPEEMKRTKDSIMTHNHRNSTCFSPEDIEFFFKSRATEFRATKRSGGAFTIRRIAPDAEGPVFVDKYYKQRQRAERNARKKLDEAGTAEKIKTGEITQEYADKEMGRLISLYCSKWLSRQAMNYGYIYLED